MKKVFNLLWLLLMVLWCRAQQLPNSISNLSLWLKSDIGVTLNGSTVSSWNDQSGNGLNTIQNTVLNQPLFISSDNNLNGYPCIKFDGINDVLTGVPIPNINSSSMTVFVVGKGDAQNSVNSAFFSINSYFAGFWLTRRAATSKIGVYNNNNLLTGTTATLNSTGFNYKLFSYNKNFGVSSTLKLNGIVDGTSTNSVAVSGFTNANYWIGSGSGTSGVNYAGSIAEVIVYNRSLSQTEQDGVEKYLMDKYAPPVNLGADIIDLYGLEDITLSTSGFYSTYTWSTGATTPTLNVNNPGQYTLTATDVFGRISKDTINIIRPDYSAIQLSNQTICYNGNTSITATLPAGDYSFVQWSDGVTSQTRTITQTTNLSYSVRDNANFVKSSNTATIIFDNSLQNISLGNDTSLCEGNLLQLAQSSPSITNYLWSTGSTANTIPINISGEYHLTVSNGNGCSKKDTIQISIQGQSPTILLNVPSQLCQNESASFSEASFVQNGEAIDSRFWNFGNGINSSQSSGSFINTVPGTYIGSLTVASAVGCQSSQSFTYSVRPKPIASYSSPLLCDNVVGQFINTSTAPGSSIATAEWLVNDISISTTTNFSYSYPTVGSYNLKLIATNGFGCKDTISQNQQVINTYPIPNAPYLVAPFNGRTVLSTEQVSFNWSAVEDNYFYELQFSNSSSFTTISNTIYTTQNNDTILPNDVGTIFWRVKANNPCLLGGISQAFSINSIQFSDSLRLWLRADNGVTLNGNNVITWSDVSLNGLNAIQNTVANQPLFISSNPIINQKPSIKFDGLNDMLSGGLIPRFNTNSLSVLVVGNGGNQSSTNSVMFSSGTSSTGWWLTRRASAGRICVINNNNSLIGATTTLPTTGYDFKLFGYNKNFGTSAQIKVNGNNEISSSTANAIGGFTNANYQIGAGNLSSYFNGDIAEIMVYTKLLNSQEQSNIEKYLMDKYAPPINLGPDIIINYGFCDTVLSSNHFFTNYLWSNGATTSSLTVNEPGTYWVRAIDIFGRISTDTLQLFRPVYDSIALQNRIVCFNNIVSETAYIPMGYSFVGWSDGVSTPIRLLNQNENLSYTVADNRNCLLTSNTINVVIDSSLSAISLGNDTNICAGNSIQLEVTSNLITNYIWNTGNSQSIQIVDTSGIYTLQVSNANGCQNSDEISVSVVGAAPNLNFYISPQACQGGSFTFWDSSTVVAPSTIDSTVWHFQNQPDFIGTTGSISYQDSGYFSGSIEVFTVQGCSNSANFSIYISPSPILEIQKSYSCSPGILELTATNSIGNDLISYDWAVTQLDITDYSSSDTMLFSLLSSNDVEIQLSVVDELGCSSSISNSFPIAPENTIQLTTPSNNVNISSSDPIDFSWTDLPYDPISTDYTFEIASDSLFVNLIHQQTIGQSNLNFSASSLSGLYFWRVKRCSSQNWSQIRKFNVVNLSNGQRLWLRSDSLKIVNGKIAQWYDRSGNGFHAVQNTINSRPILASSSPLIAHSAVKFDGVDDFLSGPTIPGIQNSSMTAFIVVNGYSQTDNGGLFTISDLSQGFGLYRGTTFERFTMLTNYGSNSLVFDFPNSMPNAGYPFKVFAMTKNFGVSAQLHGNGVNGMNNTTTSLVGSFNNANYQISGGPLGKLNGEIAEVILYDQALTTSQRNQIERYLMDRYAPPVNLGADINSAYGFCDITLSPTNEIYTSYLWNTNATSSSISINEPGTYWVQAVDVFGRTSRDTINVFRPVFGQIILENEAVCFGQSESFSAPIPSGDYTFIQWNDGLTNPTRIIDTVQSLSFTIQDSLGCQRSSNLVQIFIDSSLVGISLGNDTTLCAGNSLTLDEISVGNLNYLWNTLNTSSSQVVDTSGIYSVQVFNNNGCSNSDEISIEVFGVAPTLDYEFPNEVCQGIPITFSDSSTVPLPNEIIEVVWHFENQPDYTGASGSAVFNQSGIHQCELEVLTMDGCKNNATFLLTVFPKPIISFTTENYCPNELVEFNAFNSISSQISNFNWLGDSGAFSSNSSNPSYLFGGAGNFEISLDVTDENGCRDTVIQNVTIQEGPQVDFSIVNPCEKQIVEFNNGTSISDPFSITSYQWNISNGASSSDTSFTNVFTEYGEYQVSLLAIASNGCQDTLSQTITIHPKPILGWQVGPSCKNTWTTFESQSTIPIGDIAQTDWLVNLQYPLEGTSSAYKFVTTGVQYLNLTSTSDQGCTTDTLIIVNVQPEINAAYSVSPTTVVAGVPVVFTNNSTGGTSYEWNLGNGNIIQTMVVEPLEEMGFASSFIGDSILTYLAIQNAIGCKDTAYQYVKVNEPRIDLAINQLFVQDINGFYKVGVELRNLGFVEITQADLLLKAYNSAPILETYTEAIAPGESQIYLFNSSPSAFISTQDDEISFLCVEAISYNNFQLIETELSNNISCLNTEGGNFVLLPIYPNPTNDNITYTLIVSEESTITTSLADETGRIVQSSSELLTPGLHTPILSMRNLSAGVYYFQISDGVTSKTVKVLKN